jgi:transcriptional regulator with XRE-family HTH domain
MLSSTRTNECGHPLGDDMNIPKVFGERLLQLRKRAGLSQTALAERCGGGMVGQRVGEIERGEGNPTLDTIGRLAEGLGCDPVELFIFDPKVLRERVSQLDARLLDFWNGADEQTRAKAIRILSELT